MSVSAELLCSFELLKPLDSSALKSHIKKGRNKRNSILNSPVCIAHDSHFYFLLLEVMLINCSRLLYLPKATSLNRVTFLPFPLI